MSTSNERSTGLLSGGQSDAYHNVEGERGDDGGAIAKLRYRSPHLVLPLLIATAAAVLLILAMLGWYASRDHSSPVERLPVPLHSLVHFEAANAHLNGLQGAADLGNGTRQTGTRGYTESVRYVVSVLRNLTALRFREQQWTENGRSGTNVIADTLTGDAANTIVVGGHLDSYGGPGLNDDGTGSTAVLLLAVAVNEAILNGDLTLVNRIRFHWYDAEEAGLRGSHAAVALGVNATEVGERVRDWVCQMQADMVSWQTRTRDAAVETIHCQLHTDAPSHRLLMRAMPCCALLAAVRWERPTTSSASSTRPCCPQVFPTPR